MTVHQEGRPSEGKKLHEHLNGHNLNMVVYPNSSNMSQSWNGYIWKVSQVPQVANGDVAQNPPISNGDVQAHDFNSHPTCVQRQGEKRIFTLDYDEDEDDMMEYSYRLDNIDIEEEYVTLDRNYIFPRRSSHGYTRHMSMVGFRYNQWDRRDPKIVLTEDSAVNDFSRSFSVDESKKVKESHKNKPWSKRSLRRFAENIGSLLSPRITGGGGSEEGEVGDRLRKRSQSVSDFQQYRTEQLSEEISDDDGDDYGFLSYPFAYSSSTLAMHKTKSSSTPHTILPKRWRSKGKTMAPCLWSPEGNCTWCSLSGRKVVLKPISLMHLSDAERLALQKIALAKLQASSFGCPVVIPKASTEGRRQKRHGLSFKRRSHSANLTGGIDKYQDKECKDSQVSGQVFAISLSKCVTNDLDRRKRNNCESLRERCGSDVVLHRREPRKSSSSSHSSLDNLTQNGNTSSSTSENQRRTASSDSLSESESSRNTSSSLIDALSLSTSRHDSIQTDDSLSHFATGLPQVPQIVWTCFKHIETYGLRVLGIFRVGSSKRRTKQLREEFDSGKDVKLSESHNPHDVGALLKEYFRDLPEPLFTRDLYLPFVASRRIAERDKQEMAARLLVSLLPVANRDTLWVLLKFLSKVVLHSTDGVDVNGLTLPGNKMDSHNLATLFGPNILHKAKSSADKEFQVESMERAEERREVIDVVSDMIDNHESIFEIPSSLHDEVLRLLLETDPENTDQILKKLANETGLDPENDTTSSSVFEDSDTASLPHSPSSDADLAQQVQRLNTLHVPLRPSKSAENVTPRTRRRFFFSQSESEKDVSRKKERDSGSKPKFKLKIERSPSPKPPKTSKPPKVKISRDSSSPKVLRRPHSEYFERPVSESFTHMLAIPKPNYVRQNSSSSVSSLMNTSSTNSPVCSDSSGAWVLPTPPPSGSNSPRSPRISSSQQRPLDLRGGNSSSDDSPPYGSAEWQRDRWKHWEIIAQKQARESPDKETLV